MKEKRRAGEPEGGRRPSGGSPREEEWKGSLAKKGRWSRGRKRDLVLRLLRGESLEGLSRDLPPRTSPPSMLDPGPFEVHSKG